MEKVNDWFIKASLAGALMAATGCSDAPRAASPTATRSRYQGTLDFVGQHTIEGWAWDPQHPDNAVSVVIYDGDLELARAEADKLRQDLVKHGKGNGRHSFVVETPVAIKDGAPHSIRARVADGDFELQGSPRSVVLQKKRK